jgi:hypothetical protein
LLKFPVRQCPRTLVVTTGQRDQEHNDTEGTSSTSTG